MGKELTNSVLFGYFVLCGHWQEFFCLGKVFSFQINTLVKALKIKMSAMNLSVSCQEQTETSTSIGMLTR